tara:strand:- start:53 stop:367 length:315 start_codon:yes stop_codon:yes gene_type:complete
MPVAPKYMADAARRALEARENAPASRRAGTLVGLARANQLVNGDNLSLSTLIRMRSYLIRARQNYRDAKSKGLNENNSKAIQAYLMWGGPRALPWVSDQIQKLQ